MSSGILVPDEVALSFKELQIDKKFKFINYRIADDEKSIIIDHKEDETMDKKCKDGMCEDDAKERFDEFRSKVMATDEPKYCVVDVNCWKDEPGGKKRPVTKIGLILWCPDTLSIKKKMVFASSAEAVQRKLKSGFKVIQCSDIDDLDYAEISKKLISV